MNFSIHLICVLCSFHLITATVLELYGSNDDTKCTDATINDTCILHCDEHTPPKPQFDCGIARDCYFYCENAKCLTEGNLNGRSSLTLHAYSSKSSCYENADVYTAEHSYFEITSTNSGDFNQINIHGSAQTESIFINCDSSIGPSSCHQMTIYAQEVSTLEIIGQAPATISEATIYCPQNSPYDGPRAAPCILDFAPSGIIENSQLHTLNGIPQDVMLYGILKGTITISCTAGRSQNIAQSFQNVGDCWNTALPTTDPTATPTHNPSIILNPSIVSNPSVHPITMPSANPHFYPTLSPTVNPSNIPTLNPTLNPITTVIPSNIPTSNPTLNPTVNPSNIPTVNPSDHPMESALNNPPTYDPTYTVAYVQIKSTESLETHSASDSENDTIHSLNATDIKLIVIGALIVAICIVSILLWDVRKRKKKIEQRESTAHDFGAGVSMESVQKIQWTQNKLRIQLPHLGPPNSLQLARPKHSGSLSKSIKKVAHKLEGLAHPDNPDFEQFLAPNARVNTDVSLNRDPSVPYSEVSHRREKDGTHLQRHTNSGKEGMVIQIEKTADACSKPNTPRGVTVDETHISDDVFHDNAASEISLTHSITRDRSRINSQNPFHLNPLLIDLFQESKETRGVNEESGIDTYDGKDHVMLSMTLDTTLTQCQTHIE